MRKNKIDQDKPFGKMTRVEDFLPPPQELITPEETVKVTIALRKSSVEFFKQVACKYHTKYQKMIRELLDRYATQYSPA
jgi:predicted DNA binding CopG/RHH family protein